MNAARLARNACSCAVAAIVATGCALFPAPPAPPTPAPLPPGASLTGVVALWISADQDAYISCGRTSSCEEGDLNFGRNSPLAVAAWDLGRKKPYVHFDLSEIPANAEIIEAFVELNHNAQMEDGRTDDLRIPAGRPAAPWNAMTLTWNNSADRTSMAGPNCVRLKSRAWSSTANLAADIRGKTEFDLFLSWNYPSVNPPIEKGFASNNDISRRQNDLGIAPRLLVRAVLPPGSSVLSRSTRNFLSGQDLGRLAQPVLTSIAEPTSSTPGSWPASWQVSSDPCN